MSVPEVLLRYPPRPPLPAPGTRLTQGRVAELLLAQEAALDEREERLDAIARLQAAAP